LRNGTRSARSSLFLDENGWLSDLPPKLRSALLEVSRLGLYRTGDRVYGLGDPPGGLYGLEEGSLALEAAQSGSPPQKGFLIHPGTWIGEGPVAGLEARITGAWATRPSRVLSIEIAGFRRVAAHNPELWRHLVLLALQNSMRVIGLAQDLMLRGSRQRLAALLARLGGLRDDHRPVPAVVDATQGEIAAIANLSRGVVSRLLLEMEQEGLVRLRRANVEILDPDRLLQEREP
jgi:CRP-like cAMP-binding protein